MSRSNSRRFVRAAWSLLFFQVIAAAGAVVVTGYAALYVKNLAVQSPATQAAEAQPAPAVTELAPGQASTSTDTNTSVATSTPAPAAPAPATPQAAVAPCPRDGAFVYLPANVEWCDTGVALHAGQMVQLRVGGGWSDGGPTAYGPGGNGGTVEDGLVTDAPLGALVGRVGSSEFVIGQETRFASPADGRLHLAMNDRRGDYAGNQGTMQIYIAPQ